MIPCYRNDLAVNPFIDSTQSLTLEVKKISAASYRGVTFSTQPDKQSPHISLTHCECALHVFCRDVASSLTDVLSAKPEFAGEIPALHIKVEPSRSKELGYTLRSLEGDEGVYTVVYGSDAYSMHSADAMLENSFDSDRVVLRCAVESAVARAMKNSPHHIPPKVILLDIIGEEETMKNWAYMTNDAVSYLVQDVGVEVIVVNTPSVDRESDGGQVSNHKIVFDQQRNNLVIELAKLTHLQEGYGMAVLNVEPHDTYVDCGPSKLHFRPNV